MLSVLSLLLTPSVLLLAGIAALALFARWRGQKGLFRAGMVLAAFYYAATAPIIVDSLARVVAVRTDPACARTVANATVVVLTGGASGSARSADEIWRLDEETFRRLVFALELAGRQAGSDLLISGGAETGMTNEARMAEQFVRRQGWPEERLRVEEASTDTYTSAGQVARMVEADRPLLLVTSDLHMRRAAYVYRKAGMNPVLCGVPDPDALVLPDSVLPRASALVKFSQACKELLGLLVYAIRNPPTHVAG